MPKRDTPAPSRHRPHRIPPPLTSGTEAFEGEPVLREFAGDFGVLLWRTVRGVELWAQLEPGERAEAFPEGSYEARMRLLQASKVEPAVMEPLVLAAGVLRGGADPARISAACVDVARWTEAEGGLATALLFAQAAYACLPEQPELAQAVGRLAWYQSDLGRAETWFRQAIAMARRGRRWADYTYGYLSMASLHRDRGSGPGARHAALRALHSARRHSLREYAGVAHHTLAELAIGARREEDVLYHARQAYEAYGRGNPRVAGLANDLAYGWMDRGYFSLALPVFQSLRGAMTGPRDELFVAANTARAAAGAGKTELFEESRGEVERLLEYPHAASGSAAALLEVAHGALALGERPLALATAERARALAATHAKHRVGMEAEALMEAIRRESEAAERTPARRGRRASSELRALAREITALLEPAAR